MAVVRHRSLNYILTYIFRSNIDVATPCSATILLGESWFRGWMSTDIAFLEHIMIMTPRKALAATQRSLLARLNISGSSAGLAAITAVAIGTFQPFNAGAYVLEGPQWPSNSNPVVQLELGSAGKTLQDGNTSWNVAVSPALDSWNQIMGSLQLSSVMNSTAPVSSGDGVNSISFASSV